MKRALLVSAGLALLGLVNACGDGGGATPTAPNGPPATQTIAPAPPPRNPGVASAASGTITMVGSTPGSGASLQVRECRFGNVTRTCADGWSGTFTVSVDRDMIRAVLTVSFYDGAVLCGYAADVQQRVPAGQTVTFRPTWISLSDEFGTFSASCRLPATTTRMEAVLWSDADWTTQVTREFAGAYVFVRP